MAVVSEPPQVAYAAAVETLVERVVRALQGADDTFRLVDQLVGAVDRTAGLAAVRVLGADALLPFTLGADPFGLDDADVVAASFRAFPIPEPQPSAGDGSLPVRALRDWATGQALTRLGVADFLRPQHPILPAAATATDLPWMGWSAGLAQLSPLATRGLDSELHTWADARQVDTVRGLTRAMMRRDYLTAARLARWLAASTTPAPPSFTVEPVLRHLSLLPGHDAHTRLEIMVAVDGRDTE